MDLPVQLTITPTIDPAGFAVFDFGEIARPSLDNLTHCLNTARTMNVHSVAIKFLTSFGNVPSQIIGNLGLIPVHSEFISPEAPAIRTVWYKVINQSFGPINHPYYETYEAIFEWLTPTAP